MNRRALLGSTLYVAPLLLLARCAAPAPGSTTLNTIGTDADLIANGVEAIAVAAAAALPPTAANAATLTTIEGIAATVGKDATALQTAPASTSLVTEIVTGVQTVDPIVGVIFPVAAPAVQILNALLSMLPTFLSEAGIPTSRFAALKAPPMPITLARATLAGLPPRSARHR